MKVFCSEMQRVPSLQFSVLSRSEVLGGYCIVGNFHEAEIFAIFAIKHQLVKISSCEHFFLQTFLADNKLRKLSTMSSSRGTSNLTEN